MRTTRVALLCGALAASFSGTFAAHAASPADQAAAEVLFNEARKLVAAGNHAQACPKFAESQRLDPTAGGALSVADCFEKIGKLASAWGAFKQAEMISRDSGDSARQAEAAKRAEALAPRLAKLAIVVPPAARVAGFELRRDGAVVGEGQWGSSLPVDVGAHTIEVTAPGRKPWSTVVRIETDGSTASVEVPVAQQEAPIVSAKPFWGGQRVAGVALGGVGVVGVILGAVFGGVTLKKVSDSKSGGHCDADLATCDATGLQLQRDARAFAHASTAAFIVGGAALASGIVVFSTSPSAMATRMDTAGIGITIAGAPASLQLRWKW